MSAPTRPVLRWHGGKWRLAPWIIAQFPPHRVYVEPFGGAASVLLRKPRAYAEVYNDLDGEVVNLFRVLRSERAAELIEAIRLTPFARAEFERACEACDDPFERARRLCIRSYMGFGSDSVFTGIHSGFRTGFRANANRNRTTPAHDWANYPKALEIIVRRLDGVTIENRPALEVMAQQDSSETLHYVDPPYLPETRSTKSRKNGAMFHAYAHELDVAGHVALLEALEGLRGMVALSGYPSALYDDALGGWRRLEKRSFADGARARTEVLWLNPAAVAAKRRAEAAPHLFDVDQPREARR